MRIKALQTGSGLRGMQPVARIPECYGIYGVHESGNTVFSTHQAIRSSTVSTTGVDKISFGIASGGVRIYRPLLSFSKQRLIATCRTNGIRWYEDQTNKDITSTVRNTIRHLMYEQRLPHPLRREGLLRISSVTRNALMSSTGSVHRALQRIEVLAFDIRSGMLVFRPPSDFCSSNQVGNLVWIVSSLLRILINAVSPNEHIAINDFTRVVPYMFSAMATGCKDYDKNGFTVAGSAWKRSPEEWKHGCIIRPTWSISRQPYKTSSTKPKCLWTADESSVLSNGARHFDTWQLYDGRFWLNVSSRNVQSIAARPLEQSDMHYLRMKLPDVDRRALESQLAECAPGKVRWTLPILVDVVANALLALPTLGIRVPTLEHEFHWQVKYKYTELLYFMGVVGADHS